MMRFMLPRGRLSALPAALPSVHGVLHPAPPAPAPTAFPPKHILMNRFMSSIHQSAPPPTDLLKAPRPVVCYTEPFLISVCPAMELEHSLELDKDAAKENMKVARLMKLFEESVEDAVVMRGLLWDEPLSDEETRWLLFEYKRITGSYPRIFTTYGLMVHLEEMPRPYWRPFLDFLSKEKAIIIRDWVTKLDTKVGITMYDHGPKIPDQNMWFKGESDGSFDAKKDKDGKTKRGTAKVEKEKLISMDGDLDNLGSAKLPKTNELNPMEDNSDKLGPVEEAKANDGAKKVLAEDAKLGKTGAIIWGGNQVRLCELYFDVPCSSSVNAEAKGMYLQLKRGAPLQFLIAYTDSMVVFNAVRGVHVQDPKGENKGMYELLRSMRGSFKGLIPRWVPRPDMKFIDGLLRDKRLHSLSGGRKQRKIARGLFRQWSNQLSGEPIFTIEGKNPPGKMPANLPPKLEESCFLEVEEEVRFDALCFIANAGSALNLCI